MKLTAGDVAPDFSLPSSSGQKVSLNSLKGQKVVIFFYPKDDTPGCTIEACEFRDRSKEISDKGTKIFGVSPDNLESHDKFINKFDLNFELLADEDNTVSTNYGAWGEKNMYGKVTIGMKRMTFLIDENGNIEKIWGKVKPEGHAQQIIDAIS
ncbi:MAG: thioredoxin-dependent thiol peroxidase [SAR202 cluster bacterium]|nr:thioredoxin-dependent thiol peroxidase [Chloroflexota bacterium]MQG39393.1 thioredoxin-dependent thiol peroxidase [SAR202 cluster bacterium]|tara:strand:+ start:187 stop:645 length:459 start_codon:yes stop_codon:yes gene_type:complete